MTLLWTKGTLHHAVKGLHLWGNVSWIPISPTSTFSLFCPWFQTSTSDLIQIQLVTVVFCFWQRSHSFIRHFIHGNFFFGRKLAISFFFLLLFHQFKPMYFLPPSLPLWLIITHSRNYFWTANKWRQKYHWPSLGFSFFLLLGKSAAGWNARSKSRPLLFIRPAWGSLLHVLSNRATVNSQTSHREQVEFCFDVRHRWCSIFTQVSVSNTLTCSQRWSRI